MKRFAPIIALAALCWIVFVVNNLLLHGSLNQFGIIPRRISSLPGIIWSPFLHTSFRHLAANTLPLVILGGALSVRSRVEFIEVTAGGILIGGALTWLFARNACHVGASGLIFCYFGFLTSRTYFERTILTLFLAVICLLIYGGVLRGLLPTSSAISWESHVAGLLAGIAIARFVTRQTRNSAGLNGIKPIINSAEIGAKLKH